jgi:hypothetical protein
MSDTSDLDAVAEIAQEIRRQVMEAKGTDIRDQVAKLCTLVAHLAAELGRAKRTAHSAANVASCLANGIIPD